MTFGRVLFVASLAASLVPWTASAKQPGPETFCDAYPTSPLCASAPVDCTTCHDSAQGPPIRNVYGMDIETVLLPSERRPLDDAEFAAGLPASLAAVESMDSDGDGWTNLQEIDEGTLPGDETSFPVDFTVCTSVNPSYDVCEWDAAHTWRNLHLDVCGFSPTADQIDAFRALSATQQLAEIDLALDVCMESEFWRGRNGVLWQVAHKKIRPVGSLQSYGYEDDYSYFTWTQIDDHDVRLVLTGDFFVEMNETVSPPAYTTVASKAGQPMQAGRRAGLLTSRWNLFYNVMFTPIPRTAAARAYRAFLGWDISRLEGLYPVTNEPMDYDQKGVTAAQCATCHSTLDPLTYPFRNYNGLTEGAPITQYVPNRLETLFPDVSPNIGDTPEAGSLMGQPVNDLLEWAQVAANSEQFSRAVVGDYWRLLVGRAPSPEDQPAVEQLAGDLRGVHAYSVRKMLHDLVRTEAYGEP